MEQIEMTDSEEEKYFEHIEDARDSIEKALELSSPYTYPDEAILLQSVRKELSKVKDSADSRVGNHPESVEELIDDFHLENTDIEI